MTVDANKHNYYTSIMSYKRRNHKDVYYGSNYHRAMYKGKELVWKRWLIGYQYGLMMNKKVTGNITKYKSIYHFSYFRTNDIEFKTKVIYNSGDKTFDEVGVFGVIEDGGLLDVSSPLAGGIVNYNHEKSSKMWYSSWALQACAADPPYFYRISSLKPEARIQFYFYLAKLNEESNSTELTYVERISPINYSPKIIIRDNNLGTATEFMGGVILVETDTRVTGKEISFLCDFGSPSVMERFDENDTAIGITCRNAHILPHGVTDTLLKENI